MPIVEPDVSLVGTHTLEEATLEEAVEVNIRVQAEVRTGGERGMVGEGALRGIVQELREERLAQIAPL